MSQHYCVIIVTFGLLTAFISYAIRWFKSQLSLPFALLSMGFLCYCSISLFLEVLSNGPFEYHLGGWPPPIGIAYNVDQINSTLCLLVTGVGLLNLGANWRRIEVILKEKTGGFAALYILFVTGLNGILLTGDLFNLYVLLEIASLTGYALLALGDERRSPFASLNYVFLGTIGACFYLLGVGYLYIKTGSLNMLDVASLIRGAYTSPTVISSYIFIVIGVWIKMGFFPFHMWLPRAYTHTIGPVSSLIAPLGTKVLAYVLIRVFFVVFGIDFSYKFHSFSALATLFATVGIIYGAIFALRQTDLKRMLCFVVITEIGYLVGGLGIGNATSIRGSILHMMNDIPMTFCLFLSVEPIIETMGRKIHDLGGVFVRRPFASAIFVLGGLSVIGIPPSAGFFGKWYLIKGAIEANNLWLFGAILTSSLLNAVLFFRVIESGYYKAHQHESAQGPLKDTWAYLLSLVLVGVAIISMGLLTGPIINRLIDPFLGKVGL